LVDDSGGLLAREGQLHAVPKTEHDAACCEEEQQRDEYSEGSTKLPHRLKWYSNVAIFANFLQKLKIKRAEVPVNGWPKAIPAPTPPPTPVFLWGWIQLKISSESELGASLVSVGLGASTDLEPVDCSDVISMASAISAVPKSFW
jgi:hypothetical protein